jgi:hypothetical protein
MHKLCTWGKLGNTYTGDRVWGTLTLEERRPNSVCWDTTKPYSSQSKGYHLFAQDRSTLGELSGILGSRLGCLGRLGSTGLEGIWSLGRLEVTMGRLGGNFPAPCAALLGWTELSRGRWIHTLIKHEIRGRTTPHHSICGKLLAN